jgi:hypothetical protein
LEKSATDVEAIRDQAKGVRDYVQEKRKNNSRRRHDAIIVDLNCKRPHLHDIAEMYCILRYLPWLDGFEILL